MIIIESDCKDCNRGQNPTLECHFRSLQGTWDRRSRSRRPEGPSSHPPSPHGQQTALAFVIYYKLLHSGAPVKLSN
jgi:hypothetical protein